jgi:hypothetical protein
VQDTAKEAVLRRPCLVISPEKLRVGGVGAASADFSEQLQANPAKEKRYV